MKNEGRSYLKIKCDRFLDMVRLFSTFLYFSLPYPLLLLISYKSYFMVVLKVIYYSSSTFPLPLASNLYIIKFLLSNIYS